MTKGELTDAIAVRGDITTAQAEAVVNCVFDAMIEALLRGETIEIRGFGTMTVRRHPAYEGHNPRTGARVHVDEKRSPYFKVAKELRERVDASRHR